MKQTRSGFTIVEVALVLGIAGLIIIMAFVALPALWASQRDADRKSKVMEFISDLKTYQTNNSRGALPFGKLPDPPRIYQSAVSSADATSWQGFIRDFVLAGKSFEDPGGEAYSFYIFADGCPGATSAGHACVVNNGTIDVNNPNASINAIDSTIYVVVGATCDEHTIVKSNNNRSVAAMQILEHGDRYCQNT